MNEKVSYCWCKKFWRFWVMYADGRSHMSANKKRESLLWFTFFYLLTTQELPPRIVNVPVIRQNILQQLCIVII